MFQSTVPNNRYVNVTLYLLIKSLNATVFAFEVDKKFVKPFKEDQKIFLSHVNNKCLQKANFF